MHIAIVWELEGIADMLENNITALRKAEEKAGYKTPPDSMLESIRTWRITLESIKVKLKNIIKLIDEGRILTAGNEACTLANRIQTIILQIDSYKPASTGYRRLLITLQDHLTKICREYTDNIQLQKRIRG